MATKQFPKEDLLELLDFDIGYGFDGYEKVSDKLTETSRWSKHYQLVFKHDAKFWSTTYRVGATEQQDERPWEYDGDQIVCTEVVPVEKTVIVYEVAK